MKTWLLNKNKDNITVPPASFSHPRWRRVCFLPRTEMFLQSHGFIMRGTLRRGEEPNSYMTKNQEMLHSTHCDI